MRLVVVSGGASGIGRAAALALLRSGWAVAAADSNNEGLAALRVAAPEFADQLSVWPIDVSEESQVVAMFEALASRGPAPCGLVNSAGIVSAAPLLGTTAETFRRTLDVNLTGTFLMGREAARLMIPAGGGAIVNVGSVHGIRGSAGRSAYGASKGGVSSLTRAMAIELAASKIRVNEVLPGPIETPLIADLRSSDANAALSAAIPIGRFGRAEEVASLIEFLLDETRSSLITGQSIALDGGISAGTGLPSLLGRESAGAHEPRLSV